MQLWIIALVFIVPGTRPEFSIEPSLLHFYLRTRDRRTLHWAIDCTYCDINLPRSDMHFLLTPILYFLTYHITNPATWQKPYSLVVRGLYHFQVLYKANIHSL